MGQKLPPNQLALYQAIDEILWKQWDPCGVSEFEEARDEYYSYIPRVFALALEEDRSAIAEYLCWVEVDRMGFSTLPVQLIPIADAILAVKDRIDRSGGV